MRSSTPRSGGGAAVRQFGGRIALERTGRPGGSERVLRCFATDSVEKFERLGSRFLDRPWAKSSLWTSAADILRNGGSGIP